MPWNQQDPFEGGNSGGVGGGGVSNVTASAPLTSSGGATPNISASYNTANGIAQLNGSAQVPIAQIPTGTTSSTVVIGNDSRVTGAEQTANKNAASGYAGLDSSSRLAFSQVNGALSLANAAINVNGQSIQGGATPSNATDYVIKSYVDGLVQGLQTKGPVRLATTGALPANTYLNGALGVGATLTGNSFGALTIDSVAVAVLDRVLIKNEGTSANDGIYTVTATGDIASVYILTRSTDMNTASEFPGAYVLVLQGTTNTNRGYTLVADPDTAFVVGTTSQTWNQFTGAGDLTAGNGITISGNTISVATTLPSAYTFSSVGTAVTVTNNATISGTLTNSTLTSATSTALALTGLSNSTWQVTGGTLTVQTTSNALTVQTVTSGTLTVLSAGALTLTGNAASTWSVASANLTVSTTTSGTLAVTSAGALNLTGAAASSWAVTGGALTVQTTSQNLTVQTVTSGTLAITSAGACNVTSVAASTWAGSGGTLTFQSTSAALTVQTVTSGTLTVLSAGALTMTGNAASTWSVAAANLTVSTTTSGTLAVTSAGALTLTGAAASTWSTSSGALTITSAAACTWSSSAGNLTVSAAGSGASLVLSGNRTISGGNTDVFLTAQQNRTSGNIAAFMNNNLGTTAMTVPWYGGINIVQAAVPGGTPQIFTVTPGAHTLLTASTEVIDFNFNGNRTVQWATGALTTQRMAAFQAPTYAFQAASTLSTAATLAVTGAPAAGTNATITTPLALWVQGGTTRTDGNDIMGASGSSISFYGGSVTAKQTVTGSKGGNVALASLMTALAALGLVTDSTT